ncbi:MAG: hypothetical protein IKP64_04180 [Selenomonadaceae bacterium]|nr:hypothetical protein [Selenomonadaceae bacterium]
MWQIKRLEVVDSSGNSVSIVDRRATVSVKLDNGFRATRTFDCERTPPEFHIAIKDFIRRLYVDASNIN